MVWNLHVCLAGAGVATGLLVFDHCSFLLGGCKLQVAGQDFTWTWCDL